MPTPILPAEAPIATSPSLVSSSNRCAKCGTIKKSGKRSCCARGGTWFKNCGDGGDTKFGHTWAEGIRACKDFPSSLCRQVIIRNVGVSVDPLNTTQSRNDTQQQTNISRASRVPNISDSADCVGVQKIVSCIICILFINSRLQIKSHFSDGCVRVESHH